ncbi:MAG: 2,3-bisphosphoglycerate-independent phosphoglycerate mutase [Phycisphaeraceae bacterium]|nr:2,3-bisphosphoglycerate-independent phosphoglycerate mutase [Phycisphaeraceae bacterium]
MGCSSRALEWAGVSRIGSAYPLGVKYVIVIPDGGADLPIDSLGGKTPFEAAHMPVLADLARAGRVGCVATTPPRFEAGSDVCSMSLLGYDPDKYHTGRAPIEAAALGLNLGQKDWIFRLNLVTTGDPGSGDAGLMLDHSAGAISDAEARTLVADLMEHWGRVAPLDVEGLSLTPGVSYRNVLVDHAGRSYKGVETTPPHEIPRLPWAKHVPRGGSESGRLLRLMLASVDFLSTHRVNLARREKGQRPATMAWIWGQGTAPSLPSFESRFGIRGAMITSVDLLAGIAALIGWDRLHVPGLTSYHDTDYAAQGKATCEALDRYDVVCCHVESPDELSHQGDWQSKVAALEAIDEQIMKPLVEHLRTFGDPDVDPSAPGWRLLYMPDHYTLVSTRKHDATPVPFLVAGAYVKSAVSRPFTEAAALSSDLKIENGHDLMEYFLHGGLARVRPIGTRTTS